MVDARRLLALLDRVERDLEVLDDLAASDLDDEAVLDRVKYRLVTAIEGLLQAGQHVIASQRYANAETYADVFRILGEEGHLSPALSDAGQDIARFRNLLVHGYAVIDDRRVAEIVTGCRDDLRAIMTALADLASTPRMSHRR